MPFPTSIVDVNRRYVADTMNVESEGAPIAAWTDSSTANSDAVQATVARQPLLRKNILNGHSALEFDGDNDYLINDDAPGGWETSFTRYIVIHPTLDGPPATLFGGNRVTLENSPHLRIGAYGSWGKLQFVVPASGEVLGASVSTLVAEPQVICLTYVGDTQTYTVYVNGTVALTGSVVGGEGNIAGLGIGGMYDPDNIYDPFGGYIFETVHCDTVHDAAKRAVVHSYVQETYLIEVADYVPTVSTSNPAAMENIQEGNYVVFGGSPSPEAALSDSSDMTGMRSIANPINEAMSGTTRVPKPASPSDPINVSLRLRANSSASNTYEVQLLEGITQRGASKMISNVPGVPTNYNVAFAPADWAPISNSSWGTDQVKVRILGTAT